MAFTAIETTKHIKVLEESFWSHRRPPLHLRKHGYPPDLQDEVTKLVLQQAEVLCEGVGGVKF